MDSSFLLHLHVHQSIPDTKQSHDSWATLSMSPPLAEIDGAAMEKYFPDNRRMMQLSACLPGMPLVPELAFHTLAEESITERSQR